MLMSLGFSVIIIISNIPKNSSNVQLDLQDHHVFLVVFYLFVCFLPPAPTSSKDKTIHFHEICVGSKRFRCSPLVWGSSLTAATTSKSHP